VLIGALAGIRARIPDVEWVVIGEGPLRSRLEALASSAGVAQSVRFLGEVSESERNLWLRRADVFAMPSRHDGEGFGIAYLEASAYGKPVLAGNVAGALDAVADGVSGLLVDPSDPAAVGEALTRLLLDRGLQGGSAGQGPSEQETSPGQPSPNAWKLPYWSRWGWLGEGSLRQPHRSGEWI
jgi:phosphatidylinositol alpha-1,6-mannosyltransferase